MTPTQRIVLKILGVVLTAGIGAVGSYAKAKAEANVGYQNLVEEVKKQGETINTIERDNAEWRKLLVEALLKQPKPSPPPAPVLRPLHLPPAHPVAAPTLAPLPRDALEQLMKRQAPPAPRKINLPASL